MQSLTTALLGRASHTFLKLAYPEGEHTIPPVKRVYLALRPDEELEPLLRPPLGQALLGPGGGVRGYALRLGSARYPHLKLQVTGQADGSCVFAVDTHDTVRLPPGHPDAARWAELHQANCQVKQAIERAWEADGLLTF